MEDILINPEKTYDFIATGDKNKLYYEKYIDNNIANDFDRVVQFIGYFDNVYAIARQKAAEIEDGMSKEDAGSKTANQEQKQQAQKVKTVIAPLLTKSLASFIICLNGLEYSGPLV